MLDKNSNHAIIRINPPSHPKKCRETTPIALRRQRLKSKVILVILRPHLLRLLFIRLEVLLTPHLHVLRINILLQRRHSLQLPPTQLLTLLTVLMVERHVDIRHTLSRPKEPLIQTLRLFARDRCAGSRQVEIICHERGILVLCARKRCGAGERRERMVTSLCREMVNVVEFAVEILGVKRWINGRWVAVEEFAFDIVFQDVARCSRLIWLAKALR